MGRDRAAPRRRARLFWALALAGATGAMGAAGPAGARDIAVVTSQNAGRVSLLDAGDGRLIAEVAVPGDPVAVAVGTGGTAFVVAVKTAMLHVIGPDGRELLSRPLPGAPFGLALGPEGTPVAGHAFITDWAGAVHEIDPADGRVMRSWPASANPSGVASDGHLLVVAERDADRLVIWDLGGGPPVHVAVGRHPFGVTLAGGRAYAADVLSNTVSVVDLASRRRIAAIPTGERPYAVAFAGGRGFVTNQQGGSVTVFDAGSHAVIATLTVGEYPEGIAATPDGRAVLVANWMSDSLTRIEAASLTTGAEIALPAGPRAFGAFTGRTDGRTDD